VPTQSFGILDLIGNNQTIAGLIGGVGQATNSAGTAATLTFNTTSDHTFFSTVDGNLNLAKSGSSAQTLAGATGYTGSTSGSAGQIQTARGDGSWNGPRGIITTSGSGTFTTLGVASASDAKGISSTDTAVWGGQVVSGTDTLVMFTYGGDANLDGKVNVDD